MTARSWCWDRLSSDQRGRLILGEHLARCLVEIAVTGVVMAVQMAGYALADRLTSKEASRAR